MNTLKEYLNYNVCDHSAINSAAEVLLAPYRKVAGAAFGHTFYKVENGTTESYEAQNLWVTSYKVSKLLYIICTGVLAIIGTPLGLGLKLFTKPTIESTEISTPSSEESDDIEIRTPPKREQSSLPSFNTFIIAGGDYNTNRLSHPIPDDCPIDGLPIEASVKNLKQYILAHYCIGDAVLEERNIGIFVDEELIDNDELLVRDLDRTSLSFTIFDHSEQTYPIYVQFQGNPQKNRVYVTEQTTIARFSREVKKIYHAKHPDSEGVYGSKLVFMGKVPEENRTIQDYNIKKTNVILCQVGGCTSGGEFWRDVIYSD